MKYKYVLFILFIMLSAGLRAQNTCVNADFSLNNFTNWSGSTGSNATGTYTNLTPGIVAGIPNSPPSTTGRQTIMNLPGTDPNTGNLLSVLPPGGSNSCRLGNERAAGCVGGYPQAERLEYTYLVNSTNCIFTYQYAVVLQDPGHNPNEQPKFTIYVLNSSGAVVDPVCGIYEVSAAGNLPGFTQCLPSPTVCRPTDYVVWKNWTTVSIDLSAHIGQNITVQFTTFDCDPNISGGHFGYAYISCYCGTMQLTQQCSGNSDLITAPAGFAQYLWSTGQTTSSINIPNPVYGDTVTCTMTSFTGCTVTLSTVLQIDPVTFTPTSPTICSGETAVVTANGNYNFVWNTGQPGPTISVSPAATTIYTVTGTSAGGCSESENVTVTVNPLSVSNAGPDAAICSGATATLNASASTGTLPLSYHWSNGVNSVSQIVSPTVTTTYNLTVTSADGCTSTDEVVITVNPLPVANAGQDASICSGAAATLNASASSGTIPLSFHWSNGINSASQVVSPVATTTYNLTVTSANGCTSTDQVTVTANPLPVADAGPDASICAGTSTTLNASASSGTMPLSYHWSNGVNTASQVVSPVATTTYNLTVTSANGCTSTDQITVTANPLPVANAGPDAGVCLGTNTTLNASASTGTLPLSYHWSNGVNTASQAVSPVATTTYNLTVTSADGCTSSDQVTITLNPFPVADAGPDVEYCSANNTLLNASASTGTLPLTYHWSNGINTVSQLVAPAVTTTYSLTVTSADGCTSTDQVNITVNTLATASAGPDVGICSGANATLNASASTGTLPLTYHWSNGVNTVSQVVSPVTTTTYFLTVTSADGCISTDQVIVTVNPLPVPNVGPDTSICAGTSTTLNASASSGTMPLSYHWSNGVNTASQVVSPAATTTYFLTITSADGCTSSDQVTVTVNSLPVTDAGPDASICAGTSTTLNASASSGTMPLSYHWSNGVNIVSQVVSPVATATYNLTVTSANGCTSTDVVLITVNPLPVANAGTDASICAGTSATINASASTGTLPLSYHWSNGVNAASQVVSPVATTAYNLTVTSMNGCTSTDQVVVTVNPLPAANAGPDAAICSGNSITLNATASTGTQPLSFHWNNNINTMSQVVSPAATTIYNLTVTSASGCTSTDQVVVTVNPLPVANAGPDASVCIGSNITLNASASSGNQPLFYHWNNGINSTSQVVSPVSTTTYNLTVTSTDGCTSSDQVAITLNPLPLANAGPDAAICSGANVTLSAFASSGSPPLSYHWSNGVNTVSQVVSPVITTVYNLTVTSGSGCTSSDQVNITVKPLPVANAGPDAAICFGSFTTLSANASSGAPPLSYHWSNGVNMASQIIAPSSTTTYAVIVTDANSCTSQDNVIITVFPHPTVSIASTMPENCDQSNGGITITVSGGALPYLYRWNTNPNQYTQNIYGLQQGVYMVTVTDNNNCTAVSTGAITSIPGPVIAGVISDETCAGSGNGFIAVTVNGPTMPFTYHWSTGSNSQLISSLQGGVYSLTVTDAAGCTDTALFNVGTHPAINLTTSSLDSHCGHSDGKAFVNATGGSGAYSYLWSNLQTSQNLINLHAGTYTVTVTDGFCTSTASVTLGTLPGPTASITNPVNETCSSSNAGALAVAGGGVPGYTYHWNTSPAQVTATLQNVHAGYYAVTITDVNGCVATNSVNLTNSPPPTASITSTTQADCGLADGSAVLAASGGTPPYNYYWSSTPPQTTEILTNVPDGTYFVTVTDVNGCSTRVTAVITKKPGPTASIISQNEICYQSNGSATVTASGGTGNYTYLWNNGQTTATATGLSSGNYSVTISDGGCSATASASVSSTPVPDAGFTANPKLLTVMEGPVIFNDNSTGNIVNWWWDFGDGSASGSGTYNTHPYPNVGTYPVTLIVTDNNGCKDTIMDTIKVTDVFSFYIPNAFTPNGDGVNDVFSPKGISVDPDNFNMYIFDRWGNLMYHTSIWYEAEEKCEGWNGTEDNMYGFDRAVIDVYVYKIFAKEISGPMHEYYGKVVLAK